MLENWRKRSNATNKPSSRPPLWLIAAFVVLSCVILPATGSAEAPEGYDPHDYQKLVSFPELPNGDGKNGNKISASYSPLDPSTWTWVGWTDTLPKKVRWIQWNVMGLVGSLDVSNCEALTDLACYGNQLSSLDVSNCTALVDLRCESNHLAELDVSNCTALKWLNCNTNQLTFADLPLALPVAGGTYQYSPQADLEIGSGGVVIVGEEIDLSEYAEAAGIGTVFTWYDGQVVTTPATANGGKFAFGWESVGKIVHCEMTNSAYPGLTLRTTGLRIDPTHQLAFIKPTDANDESNPLNINSGSLVIVRIDGDIGSVDGATVSVDGGEQQQAAVTRDIVYYLLPAGLQSGQHTITIELTTKDGGRIPASVSFHWNSRRRGFGFGRFDFGDVDEP